MDDKTKLLDYLVYSEGACEGKKMYFSASDLKNTGISNVNPEKVKKLLRQLKEDGLVREGFEVNEKEIGVALTKKGFLFFEKEQKGSADTYDGKDDTVKNGRRKGNLNKYYENIHKLVIEKFIKKKYQDAKLDADVFTKYSNLFQVFVKVVNEEANEFKVNNLFEFIAQKIDETSNENFIKILGPDGTGKSTFLSLLYIYLYRCFRKEEIYTYPFYINLHYYDRHVTEGNNINELNQNVEKQIREDLKELVELSRKVEEKDIKLLIIIDGNEKYQRTNLNTKSILQEILDTVKGHKKIICIGEKTNVHSMRERNEEQFYEDQTTYIFQFSTIYIDQENKWHDVIDKYCSIINKKNQIDNIVDRIHSFRIKEVDFNLLTVFGECAGKCILKDIKSISELYNKYCQDYLHSVEKGMETSIQLSYKYFMTGEYIDQQYISEYWKEWELVHQHKTISNYLLARYYAKLIQENNLKNMDKFKCVFTNGINIFLKSILNESKKKQRSALQFCKAAFDNGDYRTQAQAAYLAGRIQIIQDRDLQEQAKDLLKDQLNKWNLKGVEGDNEKREQFFVRRSILVSLLNLGSAREGSLLLGELFRSSIMNEVNRAFYLQYYDDVDSELGKINLTDDGTATVTYTTSILLNYIDSRL